MFERGARGAASDRGGDASELERAVAARLDPVDDRAGVLADEVPVALGYVDGLEHDVEHVDAVL